MAKAIRGWLQFAASKKPPYPSLANRTHVNLRQTNNSSIVSKRSVERLYFPTEAHFLRYFVKKPQRRSPLINRGYWLRMKAIDQVVRQFLEQDCEKQKVLLFIIDRNSNLKYLQNPDIMNNSNQTLDILEQKLSIEK